MGQTIGYLKGGGGGGCWWGVGWRYGFALGLDCFSYLIAGRLFPIISRQNYTFC